MKLWQPIYYKQKPYNEILLDKETYKITIRRFDINTKEVEPFSAVMLEYDEVETVRKITEKIYWYSWIFEPMEEEANSYWKSIYWEKQKESETEEKETNNSEDIWIKLDKIIKLLEKISNDTHWKL